MTKASTKYKVSKKVVKRYLADHDLTQKQLAQMAALDHGKLFYERTAEKLAFYNTWHPDVEGQK